MPHSSSKFFEFSKREVKFKSELDPNNLMVEVDVQQPAVLVLAAVSWNGNSSLHFIKEILKNSFFP